MIMWIWFHSDVTVCLEDQSIIVAYIIQSIHLKCWDCGMKVISKCQKKTMTRKLLKMTKCVPRWIRLCYVLSSPLDGDRREETALWLFTKWDTLLFPWQQSTTIATSHAHPTIFAHHLLFRIIPGIAVQYFLFKQHVLSIHSKKHINHTL